MWKLTLLTGAWTFAVVYGIWFGVQVWVDPGLMLYAGHRLSLVFWIIPLIPLLLLSRWLLSRWTGVRPRSPRIFMIGWVVLILLPVPPTPMSHLTPGQPTVTTVSPLFWVMMGIVTLMPAALTVVMWRSTVSARRAVTQPAR